MEHVTFTSDVIPTAIYPKNGYPVRVEIHQYGNVNVSLQFKDRSSLLSMAHMLSHLLEELPKD